MKIVDKLTSFNVKDGKEDTKVKSSILHTFFLLILGRRK
jgi:hypothetical protein